MFISRQSTDKHCTIEGTHLQILPPGQVVVVLALSLQQCSAGWCFILFIWTPPVMVPLVFELLLMLAQCRGQSLQTHITWPQFIHKHSVECTFDLMRATTNSYTNMDQNGVNFGQTHLWIELTWTISTQLPWTQIYVTVHLLPSYDCPDYTPLN